MNLKDLSAPIAYRWRVQSFSKHKPQAACVAYIDARDAMKILDEVCGPENWQDDYKEVNGMLFGGVAVRVEGEWVWKWDTGSESNIEKDKGHVSDSFKRAAVKWGIGRFLYDLEVKYVPANEKNTGNNYPYVVDEMGNRVWDLTKFINGEVKTTPKKTQKTPQSPPPATQTETKTDKPKKRSKKEQDAIDKHASKKMKEFFDSKTKDERYFVNAIRQMIWEMTDQKQPEDYRKNEFAQILMELTTFEDDKTGEMVDGFSNPDYLETLAQVNSSRLRVIYGVTKNRYLGLDGVAEPE